MNILKKLKELLFVCDHDYRQQGLTRIGMDIYPEYLEHKCSKCGNKVMKRNKYMPC